MNLNHARFAMRTILGVQLHNFGFVLYNVKIVVLAAQKQVVKKKPQKRGTAAQGRNNMSVQIDMEMPKSCKECPFCKYNGIKNDLFIYFCNILDRSIYVSEYGKYRFCPLKEVKQYESNAHSNQCSEV